MSAARAKTIIALAVIVLSSGAMYMMLNPSPPAPELRAHEVLGQKVAQEAAKLGAGGKIILIVPDTHTFPSRTYDAQIKAFFRELKEAHVTIAATNAIKLDPLRLVRVSPGTYMDVLRKLTEADVVVSLLGPPLLTADQRLKLPPKTARVVAVCSGETPRQLPMKAIFDSGLLNEAIIARPAGRGSGAPSAGAARFDELFQIITPANLGDLPPAAANAVGTF